MASLNDEQTTGESVGAVLRRGTRKTTITKDADGKVRVETTNEQEQEPLDTRPEPEDPDPGPRGSGTDEPDGEKEDIRE